MKSEVLRKGDTGCNVEEQCMRQWEMGLGLALDTPCYKQLNNVSCKNHTLRTGQKLVQSNKKGHRNNIYHTKWFPLHWAHIWDVSQQKKVTKKGGGRKASTQTSYSSQPRTPNAHTCWNNPTHHQHKHQNTELRAHLPNEGSYKAPQKGYNIKRLCVTVLIILLLLEQALWR